MNETAKAIALKRAGVCEDNVCFMTVTDDWDEGTRTYDVEFCVGKIAYSCSVDAETGTVKKYDVVF